MNQMSQTTLLDLLGRRWTRDAAVTQVVVDREGTMVAFRLADNRVALAPVEDADSALKRFHVAGDTGRAMIAPRNRPQPPLTELRPGGEGLRLAPFGTGFVVVAADSRICRIGRDGSVSEVAALPGPVGGLAALANGSVLVSCNNGLVLLGPDGEAPTWVHGRSGMAGPLAVTLDGCWAAQAGEDGLTLFSIGTSAPKADHIGEIAPMSLAWSPDGCWLAAGLDQGGMVLLRVEDGRLSRRIDLPGYPAPVASLSWNASSDRLATSGAFRTIVWVVNGTMVDRPRSEPTGQSGLVVVEHVAHHPKRALIATAFENGMVTVTSVGGREDLVVRPPATDRVCGLAWTPNGHHLAFGTQDGEAAVVTFPPQMFK